MTKLKLRIYYIVNMMLITCLLSCSTAMVKNNEKSSEHIEIAILLPMTGEHANLGNRLAKILQLSFTEQQTQQHNINVFDTAAPDFKNDIAKKLIKNKTKIVIGPLYSSESILLANQLRDADIIMISLSNDANIAQDKVFVYGHAPKVQYIRLLEFFLQQGYTDFINLLPAGNYFNNLNRELQTLIVSNNATLLRSESYTNNIESINTAVNNINVTVDQISRDSQNTALPVLLVIEDPRNFDSLSQLISNLKLDQKTKLVGDWRIDNNYMQHLQYNFTGSSHENLSDKATIISMLTGEQANYIDFITYDLAKIILNISQDNDITKMLQKLQAHNGFTGISGKVKFVDNIATRPYDIIQHNADMSYEIIDKAL